MSRNNYSTKRVKVPKKPQKKALWITAFPKQVRKKLVKAPHVPKQRKDYAEYLKRRKVYLAYNKLCRCCRTYHADGLSCGPLATEIHHTRGRRGKLLIDVRYWLPVCSAAHRWIGTWPDQARKSGWLCAVGEWNTPGLV